MNKVQTYTSILLEDIDKRNTELQELIHSSIESDLELKLYEERVSRIVLRVNELLADAKNICSDATDVGLEDEAKDLEAAIRTLRTTKNSVADNVDACRDKLGVF